MVDTNAATCQEPRAGSPHLQKPTSVSISPFVGCNLRCRMCHIWKYQSDKSRLLTTGQLKGVLADLHSWLGNAFIDFSGADTFSRPDMIEVMAYAAQLGFVVAAITNGLQLTESRCAELKRAKVRAVIVSLESLDPEAHNYMRAGPDSHALALRAIQCLSRISYRGLNTMSVNVATILSGRNFDGAVALVDFVERERLSGITFQPISPTFGEPYSREWYLENEFWPRPEQLARVDDTIDALIARKLAGAPIYNSSQQLAQMKKYFRDPNFETKPGCGIKESNFCINEYGDVRICYFLDAIGNVTKQKPEHIWTSSAAASARDAISKCTVNCFHNYRDYSGGPEAGRAEHYGAALI